MIAYLRRTVAAQLRQGRTLYALTTLGVALGVASVVCIQTLNRSALAAFNGGMQAVSGDADLTVRGTGPDFDETLLRPVLADRDVAAAWPLHLTHVAIADTGRGRQPEFLEVVGIDLFAPVRYPISTERVEALGARPDEAELIAALVRPGWVALTPSFAEERGLAVGDSLQVSIGRRRLTLHVGALVDFQKIAPLASRKLALMDIAQAQSSLGRRGRIQQIDLVLAPGADTQTVARRLESTLGPSVRVVTPAQREQDAAGLLAAFRLNLTALSLISVFVGVFLIFSAIHASLVRRRREFGLLRSLGATRDQVLLVILAEAALLGLLGTVLGLPLGYLAARANVGTVSGTLTSIYLLSEIEKVTFPPAMIALGALVGVGGAVLGALLPARDMSRRDTVSLLSAGGMQERLFDSAPRLALVAMILSAAALVWFLAGGHEVRASGFVLACVLLVAMPLVVPWLLRTVCGRARPRGLGLAMSLRTLAVRLQSTSFAVAALAVTVSMLVGITLMIGSFRRTLETWIDLSLEADVYVTTESWLMGGEQAVLGDALADSLAYFPGVRAADLQRHIALRTPGGRLVYLNGIARRGQQGERWAIRVPLLAGEPREVERAMREDGAVLIAEPLARKAHLAVGDTLRLAGPLGPIALPIAGIGYDYSTDSGTAFVTRRTLDRLVGPGETHNLALYLQPGVQVEQEIDRLRARFGGLPLEFRSNARLRGEILEIFEETFAVTRILQVMALLIAVCGISLTLIILARERAVELALLRALGATRGQIFRLNLGEGAAMGVAGLVVGLAGGAVLAAILILLVNRAYFGWTIRLGLPWQDLARQAAWILAAAVAASVYPAFRGSRTAASELTREDLQ